ncbi:hypothetical protein Aph01nite_73600 [Acrocarpospora phusangensis]|uniref:Uncharacterized protein n=1 Tax=Acrocarpospora phusangensis TaxID=1070424 RepID=A0A919QMM6_9ACTN|nr:hypothetical protein Aph01nite_73600 [Acrocarpospora phusangensis]
MLLGLTAPTGPVLLGLTAPTGPVLLRAHWSSSVDHRLADVAFELDCPERRRSGNGVILFQPAGLRQ